MFEHTFFFFSLIAEIARKMRPNFHRWFQRTTSAWLSFIASGRVQWFSS